MDGIVTLVRGDARAAISSAGAECRSWSVAGNDLLWSPDAAFWTQSAPVLFPVCGWTRDGQVRVDGRTYPLGLHGFASRTRFEVAARGADFVRMRLRDTAATRALYPFAFELAIEYRLGPSRLSVRACVRNRGEGAMPYAFGLHPGFRWPFGGGAKEDYAIVFDEAEDPRVPVIAPGGLFSASRRTTPLAGERLPLSDDVFAREALCFLDARGRGVTFEGPGGRSLRVETEGFPHFVLWSRPGAPFLCVETWTGYGDPEGYEGELADKPSMILLAPGETRIHAAAWISSAPAVAIS